MKQETKQTPSPSIHKEARLPKELDFDTYGESCVAVFKKVESGEPNRSLFTMQHYLDERPFNELFVKELVKRWNAYETLLQALEDLSKEVSITGLDLNVKKHFSLLVAKAYADKLI